jgi:hypothetical protein
VISEFLKNNQRMAAQRLADVPEQQFEAAPTRSRR